MTWRQTGWIGTLVAAAVLGWLYLASDAAPPDSGGAATHTLYVVEHGWHAGIALARAEVSAADWAVARDFPGTQFLEVGWGDADFYQAADPGTGALLKAGLWPTESVLHVAAFRRPVTEVFARREIIRIRVSDEGFGRLLRFIRQSHARDSTGQPIPLGPGLYGTSQFYAAEGRYHALHNCNTWTMRALKQAGCPAPWLRTFTVGGVLRQARSCGTVVQPSAE